MEGKDKSPILKDVPNPCFSFHALEGGCSLDSRFSLSQIERRGEAHRL